MAALRMFNMRYASSPTHVLAKPYKPSLLQVFGLGQSKAYPACYQAVGRAMDKRLEELGAKRFFERGEGDDSEECVLTSYRFLWCLSLLIIEQR